MFLSTSAEPAFDRSAPVARQVLLDGTALPTGEVLRLRLADGSKHLYYLYLPTRLRQPGRVMVAVHGISRNAREHAERFAPLAEEAGVVLIAPRFGRARHARYQRLAPDAGGRRPDRVLDAIVAEVRERVGLPESPLHLFGFSGGGQFVHRYAMAHPERVARAVVGAAGWYTYPDVARRYPRGLRARSADDPVIVAPACLTVPMSVIVGGADTDRDDALNQSRRIDRQQGETRLERGRRWVAAMRDAAADHGLETRYRFQVLPGVGHDFTAAMTVGSLGRVVFEHLFAEN